jgi:hypothetical protein
VAARAHRPLVAGTAMEETAAAARRGDVSSRGVESGDGQTSGLRAQQEGPEGGVWQYEKINRIGEGTYGVVCASPCPHKLPSRS